MLKALFSKSYWETVMAQANIIPLSPCPQYWDYTKHPVPSYKHHKYNIKQLSTENLQRQLINIKQDPTLEPTTKKVRLLKISNELERRLF